jgi:NAD dependent epimerase/dehydratase family enzyme
MTNPGLHSLSSPPTQLTVAVSGSTGLLGSAIVRVLEQRGHVVRALVRRPAQSDSEITWDPETETIDAARLVGVDAVINLAGESLAQRWSDSAKRRIRDSRVKGTATLARAIASLDPKPRALLSGSAIGIYGLRGDETLDEASTLGNDFLASVAKDWRQQLNPRLTRVFAW